MELDLREEDVTCFFKYVTDENYDTSMAKF